MIVTLLPATGFDPTEAAVTVRDANYLSARWPGDAHTFAHRFVALLNNA